MKKIGTSGERKMNGYNICTNRTNKDPTAKAAINGIGRDRLGLCQYFVYVFNKYIGRKRFQILNIVIEDKQEKIVYRGQDLL